MFWIMHHYLMLYLYVQAASFGGTNIDPTAWEDKKCPGESRFPAQVCSPILLDLPNCVVGLLVIKGKFGLGSLYMAMNWFPSTS